MQFYSTRSLRRAYLDWVEEQLENYKETISRSDLLRLADEVVSELRVSHEGQYQLTEMLLCAAVDRRIFKLLGLPSYRAWCNAYLARLRDGALELDALSPLPAPPSAPLSVGLPRLALEAVCVN